MKNTYNRIIIALIVLGSLVSTGCLFDSDEEKFDASRLCPEEGMNSLGMPNRGTFKDPRDNRVYRYTTIGKRVWMAENLKYEAPYSICKNGDEGHCEIFGRYYSMQKFEGDQFPHLFNPEVAATVCPVGWHVSTYEDWDALLEQMGGEHSEIAATRLKSADTSWVWESGTDDCGFSALPAGLMTEKQGILNQGEVAEIHAVKEGVSAAAVSISSNAFHAFCAPLMVVRCVMDKN